MKAPKQRVFPDKDLKDPKVGKVIKNAVTPPIHFMETEKLPLWGPTFRRPLRYDRYALLCEKLKDTPAKVIGKESASPTDQDDFTEDPFPEEVDSSTDVLITEKIQSKIIVP